MFRKVPELLHRMSPEDEIV